MGRSAMDFPWKCLFDTGLLLCCRSYKPQRNNLRCWLLKANQFQGRFLKLEIRIVGTGFPAARVALSKLGGGETNLA